MKIDLYQQITDQFIELLEQGTKPWEKRWVGGTMPCNPVSGTVYSGINVPILWMNAGKKGFTCQQWVTFKQAKEKGGSVKRGEKGTTVIYFKFLKKEDAVSGKEKKIPLLKSYSVFNLDQCEGLDHLRVEVKEVSDAQRIAHAEKFIRAMGADVRHGGDRAFYRPSEDFIMLPEAGQFTNVESYYATSLHEHAHWTGHKDRLGRDLSGRFGKNEYAMEELVAEMAAAFLCAEVGILSDIENHASYLASWLKVLRDDKHAIFKASSMAKAAAEFCKKQAGAEVVKEILEAQAA